MTGTRAWWVGLVVAGLGLVGAAQVLQVRDARYPEQPLTPRLLYLRSGRVADRVMLSFDALAADVYWMRVIQHFGRDRRSSRPDRFALLEPLLDLTTTLDPHFNVAYRFGAVFLGLDRPNGAGRPDAAIALLEKGLRVSPERWQYAHDIGFIHYWFTRDSLAAADWFDRAAAMPGAPEWIGPLAVTTRAQGGDRTGARQLLRELADSEDDYIRAAAERGLAQLIAMDQIDELNGFVARFFEARQRYPEALEEFVQGVPVDPSGVPFVFDPERHQVVVSPASPLSPLPRAWSAQ